MLDFLLFLQLQLEVEVEMHFVYNCMSPDLVQNVLFPHTHTKK